MRLSATVSHSAATDGRENDVCLLDLQPIAQQKGKQGGAVMSLMPNTHAMDTPFKMFCSIRMFPSRIQPFWTPFLTSHWSSNTGEFGLLSIDFF